MSLIGCAAMLSAPSCFAERLRRRAARDALRGIGLPLVLQLALSGCGGSASETPFPAEPADVDLGPAGEEERAEPASPTTPKGAQPTPSSPRVEPKER